MCEIKRISSGSHCPQAPDFKITLNIAGETEVIEVCEGHYEGALSHIGTLMRYWRQFELRVQRLTSVATEPNILGQTA